MERTYNASQDCLMRGVSFNSNDITIPLLIRNEDPQLVISVEDTRGFKIKSSQDQLLIRVEYMREYKIK
jgi:hypothetical protein